MIHTKKCVVAAAALWRSGRIADPRMCNTGLTRSNRSNKLRVPQGRSDSSPSTPIMPTADTRPSTQAGVWQSRDSREEVGWIAVKERRSKGKDLFAPLSVRGFRCPTDAWGSVCAVRPKCAPGGLTENRAKPTGPTEPFQTFSRTRLPLRSLRERRSLLDLAAEFLLLALERPRIEP